MGPNERNEVAMARSGFTGVWAEQERIRRAPHRRRRILLGCALLVVAALVAHMVIATLTTPPPPTSLRVQRIAGPAHMVGSLVYVIQPLDRTLTDPGTVQHLYSLALGLPQDLPAVGSCKPDVEQYILTFSRGTTVVLTGLTYIWDCGDVVLYQGNPNGSADFTTHRGSPDFWSALAQALGISMQEFYPTPVSAPTPSPTPTN